MSHVQTFKLNSGASMPRLGYGTWQSAPGEVGAGIEKAIEVGFRHLDFAKVYGNQKEVGAALKKALSKGNVKREDLFLVSKLWNTQHDPKDVEAALDDCLEELGLDYLDLYIIHFPAAFKSSNPHSEMMPVKKGSDPEETIIDDSISIVDTWKAMTKLPKSKARAVGVSNFSKEHLETIIKATGEVPACDQVERHPRLQDHELLQYAKEKGIAIVAYSPLGNNTINVPLLTEHETIKAVAKEANATPGQVLINWAQEKEVTVIPKTVTLSRVEENFKPVKLSAEQIKRIDEIGEKEPKRFNVPFVANAPRWPINLFNTPEEKGLPHQVVLGA